jgi:hypothetical protein
MTVFAEAYPTPYSLVVSATQRFVYVLKGHGFRRNQPHR